MQNDTIAALATPAGVGGVGVIRVSGSDAFSIVQPLLRRPGKQTALPPSHQLIYGHIVDPATQEVLDEVLVAFMSAPRTYTRENVVEIQGHGGPFILSRILRTVLAQGARMANPGEFTLRAFLNGRLDLAQAEAVMDLIESQTEAGQRLAMQQLRGRLSEQMQEARIAVLDVIARIEASIDFPEEDVPTPQVTDLLPLVAIAQQHVVNLLAGSEKGRLYRQGLRTTIIGRPNVGKSSLLNALLRSERAIVAPIAGTTRDTVEEVTNLRGIPLHLIDTAGITPTDDPVEQLGVQRSRAAAESADVVLLVFDRSEPLNTQDRRVCSELYAMGFGSVLSQAEPSSRQRRPVILVLNKADRDSCIDIQELRQFWPRAPIVQVSTVRGDGLSTLEDVLAELILLQCPPTDRGNEGNRTSPPTSSSEGNANRTAPDKSRSHWACPDGLAPGNVISSDSVLVTSVRHQEALRRASEHLRAAMEALERHIPLDFVSIDLHAAYDALGEVTGETASDDLLDRIFSEFCIGK